MDTHRNRLSFRKYCIWLSYFYKWNEYGFFHSSGWFPSPNTATFVDNGDGSTATITNTGEPPYTESIYQTSLVGTSINCGGICVVPGNYPSGAIFYSYLYAADRYVLYSGGAITDSSGSALTALPTIGISGSPFCDPNNYFIFVPISPAPASGVNNYNVYSTVSCLNADIATVAKARGHV